MTPFDRNVIRQLGIGVVFVTAGLTGVLWLSQSLRFVDLIVNRGLGTGTFFHLIMLLLPDFLVVILPVAVFVAVLFTYARLLNDREVVVLAAVGVSPLGLAKPALVTAAAATAAAYALYFTVIPAAHRTFKELQWDIRYNYSHVLLEEGAFADFGKGITVYVRERSSDGSLRGILVHDARDRADTYTLMAERGALVQTDEGARVVLFNGSRQQVDEESNKFSILYFDRYAFDLDQRRETPANRFREARERSLSELFDVRNDPGVPERDYGKFIVEAHRRLTAPVASVGFTLIGVAALLTGRFRRSGQLRASLVAIALVTAFATASLAVENIAARNLAFLPLMYLCILLPVAGGLFVLFKQPQLGGLAARFRMTEA